MHRYDVSSKSGQCPSPSSVDVLDAEQSVGEIPHFKGIMELGQVGQSLVHMSTSALGDAPSKKKFLDISLFFGICFKKGFRPRGRTPTPSPPWCEPVVTSSIYSRDEITQTTKQVIQ